MTTQDKIKQLLHPLPHKLKVTFAIFCANDVKHLMNKDSKYCLEITEKWLKDSTSVSNDELRVATTNAYAAYANIATAANIAASDTAYAAANAAYCSAYAATYSAIYAANSAAEQTKLIYYYNHLISMINNLSTFEKIMWGLYD